MPDWNPKANDIFVRAAEIEPLADRWLFVEQQCDGDAALRGQVESLLAAGGQVGSFLQRPAVAPAADDQTAAYRPLTEGPGMVIGPYKLLQHIGEGGFGAVYMAEQEQPVRRKVALKIIKPGMDTREVIARFESERQALAMMDHPNIARVFDAGETESGRPYFVMELVRGIPITDFCDKNKLSAKDRLKLFIAICNAVQHAHHKGIIHRDIKPSNVMVTLHDGVPVVKVIDFGVAKATAQKLTEKTLFTAYGQMVGTPAYMSPEQAEMSGLDIDTRSDIYSLGVLLYELLTGTTPLDSKKLRQVGYAEMQRLIREEEAPRPSTRFSSLGGEATALATNRGTDAKRHSQLLRSDLDWIVMKSLEKDRGRRYGSPANFAADIERYLANEAVEACPPTFGYRLRKTYRRNRAAVLTGGLIALVMLTATVVSVAFGVVAKRAEGVAEERRQEADANATRADEQRDIALKAGGEAAEAREKTEKALILARSEQDRTRRMLYASQMGGASLAFTESRAGQLIRFLDEAAPRPGEPDLRGWEWHFLDRQTRTDRQYKLDSPPLPQQNTPAVRFDRFLASRDGRWLCHKRAVGNGFVYDVIEAATGRKVGQVPKTEILRGDSLLPVVSEDGRHVLVVQARVGYPLELPSSDPKRYVPRIWDVESGTSVPAPADLLKNEVYLHQYTVALGPNAAWLAWLELTDANPIRGALGIAVKGPVEYVVARWEATTGRVTRTKMTLGNGWGMGRLGPDGRAVHWYPMDDRAASGRESSGPNIDYGNGECQVWDAAQPKKPKISLRVAIGPSAQITSPTWAMLAVKDRRTVTVHDLTTGGIHWQTSLPVGYVETSEATAVGFRVSDDGNRLVFPSSEMLTVLEKGRSGDTIQRRITFRAIPNDEGRPNTGVFGLLPDGRTVTHRSETRVRVWDVSEDRKRLVTPTARGGRRLVTDDQGRPWFVMTTADGRRTVKWSAPPLRDSGPAGENAAPRHLIVLDGEGKELEKFELGSPGTNEGRLTDQVRFVDSDRRLLLNTYRLKDARPGLVHLSVPSDSATRLDRTLEWSLFDLEKPGFERVAGGTGHMLVAPNSQYLVWFNSGEPGSLIGNVLGSVLGRERPTITLYEARSGKVARVFHRPPGGRFTYPAVGRTIDPTGSRVVVLTTKGAETNGSASVRVEVCDIASGEQSWATELPDVQLNERVGTARESFQMAARFTPDGNRVIVLYQGKDGLCLGVWSATSGQHERTLPITSGPERMHQFSDLTLSPTGRHFALRLDVRRGVRESTNPVSLDVWNLDTGERTQRIKEIGGEFGLMALNTDGTRLFATDSTPQPGEPGRLHIWDVTTGREVFTVPLDYDPNPYRSALIGLRYDAGKLLLEHPLWTRVLDGTPLPEAKK